MFLLNKSVLISDDVVYKTMRIVSMLAFAFVVHPDFVYIFFSLLFCFFFRCMAIKSLMHVVEIVEFVFHSLYSPMLYAPMFCCTIFILFYFSVLNVVTELNSIDIDIVVVQMTNKIQQKIYVWLCYIFIDS